jgi:N-carbamoyl-L-amino-acid hydrolase
MEWLQPNRNGAGSKQRYRGQLAPMGMIFVPSCDGISHSLKEFTAWADVGNRPEVRYRTVLELDGELNH